MRSEIRQVVLQYASEDCREFFGWEGIHSELSG